MTGIRSVGIAAVGALVLTVAAVAVATVDVREGAHARPVPFAIGLHGALLTACAQDAGIDGVDVSETSDGGITITRTNPDGDFSVDTDALSRCQKDHPVDDALARSDDRAQRRLLVLWYAETLVPCLKSHGVDTGRFPRTEVFERLPYGYWDPYDAVPHDRYTVKELAALQRDCPAAPPAVLAHAETAGDGLVWNPFGQG